MCACLLRWYGHVRSLMASTHHKHYRSLNLKSMVVLEKYLPCNLGVSPLMDSGKLHSESKTKAEIILKQFSSVFVRSNSTTMPPVKLRVQDGIQSIKIVSEGVERLLLNIQSHKGPDKYTKPSPQ